MANTTASPSKWFRKKLRTLGKISRRELPISFILRNKLQKIKRIARLNTLEDVKISKLLIGQQCGTPLKEWVEKTKEYKRVSLLLADSPYVKFLSEVDNDKLLLQDKARLKKTAYFLMSQISLKSTGSFMGNKDEGAIINWMKEFYNFYTFDKRGVEYTSKEFLNDGHSGKNDPVQVLRLKDSDYYEIIDGHHRCAIAHMCKMEKITVEVAGSDHSYLQKLIINSSKNNNHKLLQPVKAPEIMHWPATEGCRETSELMFHFLENKTLLTATSTYLDIPCKYGYFLNTFKNNGLEVYGVDAHYDALQIAKIMNNISDNECSDVNVDSFLQNSKQKFDIVSSCITFQPNKLSADTFKNFDRITNKVLFLYSLQPELETNNSIEWITKRVDEHTDFKEITPLGKNVIVFLK